MKRMVLLALMLAVLCAGCTLENGTPEPGSETEQSVSQEEVSESGPTETELEEAARLEILMKEVLCYESSHGGAPYEYGQPGFIAWDFGEVYLDLTSNREEPAEEQNALIQTMSEAWFGCPGEQKAKYGYTSAYFVGEPRVKARDYQFSDDRAEVTVSRSWKGQKLYDARYTFVAEPAPEGLEGTCAEKLIDNGKIWRFDRVEWLGNEHEGEFIEISTAEELLDMAQKINSGDQEAAHGNYRLTQDIDLTGVEWEPIGSPGLALILERERMYGVVNTQGFQGVFDGAGHRITGLEYSTETREAGFFGCIAPNAEVRDLTVEGTVLSAPEDYWDLGHDTAAAGGFAAAVVNGAKVENCHFIGSVDGYGTVGGFVGLLCNDPGADKLELAEPAIKDCTFQGEVTATYNSGGFVGAAEAGIEGCSAQGTLTIRPGEGENRANSIGGFVGSLNGTIVSCHCGMKIEFVLRDPNWMGNFTGFLSDGGMYSCTMDKELINPEWYMVGYQDMLHLPMEVEPV